MKSCVHAHTTIVLALIVAVLSTTAGVTILAHDLSIPGFFQAGTTQPCSQQLTTYTVTFSEKGLAQDAGWYVYVIDTDLNLQYSALSSTTGTIAFNGYPGNYTVEYQADGNYTISALAQKEFEIVDRSYSINITFYETFPVSLEASNIPANLSWGFRLEGSPNNQYLFGEPGTYIDGGRQVQNVVNGTYSLSAGEQVRYGLEFYSHVGSVTVNGAPVLLNLSFNILNLSAAGLPENTTWGFYGSISYQLSNGSMYIPYGLYPGKAMNATFYLPEGTIRLQPVAPGYWANGTDLNISSPYTDAVVHFQKEYPVTFMAKGITPFMPGWQVAGIPYTFDGAPVVNGASYSLTYMIPNGTYNASISFPYGSSYWVKINGTDYVAKMIPNPANETITVSGKPLSVNVTFHISYAKYVSPMERSLVALLIVGGLLGTLGASVGAVALVGRLRKRI